MGPPSTSLPLTLKPPYPLTCERPPPPPTIRVILQYMGAGGWVVGGGGGGVCNTRGRGLFLPGGGKHSTRAPARHICIYITP